MTYHQLALAAAGRSPATLALYLLYERRFLEFLRSRKLGIGLDQLNPPNVRQAVLWFQQRQVGKRGGEVATKTFLNTLKIWASFLAAEGVYTDSPLRRVQRMRTRQFERRPYTRAEVNAMLEASANSQQPERDRLLVLLLLDSGARAAEIAGLRLGDVRTDTRTLRVFGKGGRERTIPIGDPTQPDGGPLFRALRAWRHPRQILVDRHPDRGGDRLLLTRAGYPLTPGGVTDIVERLGAAAGVEGAIPHRFRHAQPLHSPVLTPNGWRTMGELAVGDYVIGSDGLPTLVLGVYPQGPQSVVRVRFSDGATTECTLDHLWTVRPSLSKCWPRDIDHWRVMPTCELMESPGPWHTPVVSPIEFESQDALPIEPYTLGALLGDGHFGRNITLATAVDEREVITRIEAQLPPGVVVSGEPGNYMLVASQPSGLKTFRAPSAVSIGKRRPDLNTNLIAQCYLSGATTWEIATLFKTTPRTVWQRLQGASVPLRKWGPPSNPLLEASRELGLFGQRAFTKAIPPVYLTASTEARREVLRGLMDTDGYVNSRGSAEFTTISPTLAAGVVELVRSLGGIAVPRRTPPSGRARQYAYRVGIRTPFTPFHMTRKRERYEAANPKPNLNKPGRAARYELVRTIKSVEPVGVTECVCIQVAKPDGLYVTQDYVLTHNSMATIYLTRYPGDEVGLRRILGQVSAVVMRNYVHLANTTIAQRAGRVSPTSAWLNEREGSG